MLSKGPTELFSINEVRKAIRWDIAVEGFTPPGKLTKAMFVDACQNFLAVGKDEFAERWKTADDATNAFKSLTNIPNSSGGGVRAVVEFAGYVSEVCTIDVRFLNDKPDYATIVLEDQFTNSAIGNAKGYYGGRYTNLVIFYPGETPLANLR